MKLIALLTILLGTAFAAPIPEAAATSAPFRLRSVYITGNTAFGNQEVVSYHTGAGFNAAVFTKTANGGDVFTLVNKQAVTFLPNYNYSLALTQPDDFYAGWGSTSLNIGSQNAGYGFAINSTGHFVGLSSEFVGWRICSWVHDVPELFHDTLEAVSSDVPLSCAKVYLVPVYTS